MNQPKTPIIAKSWYITLRGNPGGRCRCHQQPSVGQSRASRLVDVCGLLIGALRREFVPSWGWVRARKGKV